MTRHSKQILLGGVAVAAVATAVAFGTSSGSAQPFSDTDPATAPIPAYDYDDPARSFVVQADFTADHATVTDVTVGMGRSRSHLGDPAQLELRLRDAGDQVLQRIDSRDPRWVLQETAGGGEQQVVRPGPGILVTPFDADAESMVVFDNDAGQVLTTVDLAPAIRDYCLDHPDDAQCVEADLAVQSTTATGDTFSVVGATTPLHVATTVANLGPDGPVDATVTEQVSVPQGVTVTPADGTWHAAGLAVGTPQEHSSTYDVTCTEPGSHTVTVTSTIAADRAKVADPVAGNDTGTTQLTIDCAVPVALDVKPGTDPNPVNVREAIIPMAVLTTSAGERGLPVAFDATRIRAASVRIGNRADLVGSNAGVPESHGRVHLEDVDRDGDTDGVLHAAGRQIPVTTSTTELCVRGTTSDGLSFFGCDHVVVVP
ncbi:MAG TPA: hypothetical protein VNS55_04560 [Nocardioides sp.]|nr:hypothetical protein [Nocardioides sp.]